MQFMEQDCFRVSKEIANEAIYAKHVRDNVTVIIIALNRGVKPQWWSRDAIDLLFILISLNVI
jgi:hypothetical protein